ncbi:MAG: hypothetical protein QY326_08060 [Bdellovibrionota bacterium]|nr:MAG: hypothetical protein QY326_08060 [Bdellovibrionota bacterium]
MSKDGQDERGPTILKLNELTPTDISRILAATPPASDGASEQASRAEAPAADLEPALTEDQALEYLTGNVNSFLSQAEFATQVARIRRNPPTGEIKELLASAFPEGGLFDRQLQDATEIVKGCRRLQAGEIKGFQEEVELARRIEQVKRNPLHGLAIDEPYMQLELEGLLTEKEATRLSTTLAAYDAAKPATVRLAAQFEQRCAIDGPSFVALNVAVNQLSLSGATENKLEGPLKSLLQSGSGAIEHLTNVAQLSSIGVEPMELLAIAKPARVVVAEAAAGRFDLAGVDPSTNAKHVSAEIRTQLAVIRKASPELREAIVKALTLVPDLPAPFKAEMRTSLLTIGERLTAQDLKDGRLARVVEDLAAFAAAGGKVGQFTKMVELPVRQLSTNELLGFLADMADLHRQRVSGVGNLFASAMIVWRAEHNGDTTQNLRGFLIEARTAMLLSEHGFIVRSISSRVRGDRYEFDIVAQSPDGTVFGIEVKRQLSTISLKDAGRAFDNANRSQLAGFLRACANLGLKPMIAVYDYDSRAESDGEAVRHILEHVREKVGGGETTFVAYQNRAAHRSINASLH